MRFLHSFHLTRHVRVERREKLLSVDLGFVSLIEVKARLNPLLMHLISLSLGDHLQLKADEPLPHIVMHRFVVLILHHSVERISLQETLS